jgi:acyl-coenzyme A synthetase/AMP-(fatty) acid ligase
MAACAVLAAGLTDRACAPPVSPLPAVMAAAARAGTLAVTMMRAMVNRDVDVRFSDRERIKVIFQSGTPLRAHRHPCMAGPLVIGWRMCRPDRACIVLADVAGSRRLTGYSE